MPHSPINSIESVQDAWDGTGLMVKISLHAGESRKWFLVIDGKNRQHVFGPANDSFKLFNDAIDAALSGHFDKAEGLNKWLDNGRKIQEVRTKLHCSQKDFCDYINNSELYRQSKELKQNTLSEKEKGKYDNTELYITCLKIESESGLG
ncbi:MAG TPA: hypothetical protein PKC94_23495 [Leptospiraceae bacterium]|nr:hypothetical protein [Leptospiraceae bacterium]HNA10419.1 hypothetical protein [Leptospiraceae bacterium]